ncbi:MAG: hypothetical protein ACE5JX_17995 [Acidobacteriota bacterium]
MGITGARAFRMLAGELAASEGRDFERRVLQLIRFIREDAVGAPARLSIDRSGVDILAWSDDHPFPLVIQCKGFKVQDHELGRTQIENCRKSIAAFRESGLTARVYVLIHNRTGQNPEFRERVGFELADLVRSGVAEEAQLWDRHTLLRNIAEAIQKRVRSQLALTEENLQEYSGESLLCGPVREVPFRTANLFTSQYKLERATEGVAPDPRLQVEGF